ncbi:unnamed protein product [Urochloa humidicola]
MYLPNLFHFLAHPCVFFIMLLIHCLVFLLYLFKMTFAASCISPEMLQMPALKDTKQNCDAFGDEPAASPEVLEIALKDTKHNRWYF